MDIKETNRVFIDKIIKFQNDEIKNFINEAVMDIVKQKRIKDRWSGIGMLDHGPLPKFEVGDKVIEKDMGPGFEIWNIGLYDDHVKSRRYQIMRTRDRFKRWVFEKNLTLAPSVPSPKNFGFEPSKPSVEKSKKSKKQDINKWKKGSFEIEITNMHGSTYRTTENGYIKGVWGVHKRGSLGWLIIHIPSGKILMTSIKKKVLATKTIDTIIFDNPSLLTQKDKSKVTTREFQRHLFNVMGKVRALK